MVFLLLLIQKSNAVHVDFLMIKLYVSIYLFAACMSDDVELYGLKAKSNQFKTLRRRRIARQVNDSILDELDDVEDEEVNVINDDVNVNC